MCAQCVCSPGYRGARCERVGAGAEAEGAGAEAEGAEAEGAGAEAGCARARCENGALCRRTRYSAQCVCAGGYEGTRCERCAGGPECGPGGVCVRTELGAHCRDDICRFFCLNQVPLPSSTDTHEHTHMYTTDS